MPSRNSKDDFRSRRNSISISGDIQSQIMNDLSERSFAMRFYYRFLAPSLGMIKYSWKRGMIEKRIEQVIALFYLLMVPCVAPRLLSSAQDALFARNS